MNVVKAPVTQSDPPDGLLHRAILEVALPNWAGSFQEILGISFDEPSVYQYLLKAN